MERNEYQSRPGSNPWLALVWLALIGGLLGYYCLGGI